MFDGIENAKASKKRTKEHFDANGMKQISVLVPVGFEDAKKRSGLSWRGLIVKALTKEQEAEELKINLQEATSGLNFLKNRVLRQQTQIKDLNDKLVSAGLESIDFHKSVIQQ
jgi:hypothetical protein